MYGSSSSNLRAAKSFKEDCSKPRLHDRSTMVNTKVLPCDSLLPIIDVFCVLELQDGVGQLCALFC